MAVAKTFWLTVTNVALGLATMAAVGGTAVAALREIRSRAKKRAADLAALDRELKDILGSPDPKARDGAPPSTTRS
jgi:hypothetical protein